MYVGRILTMVGTGSFRTGPKVEEVKRELQAIFRSAAFSHSTRQTKLLEYLCNKVLLGESDQIKAATIGVEVFGRPWDFDESKDAIVRVEAHRLRKKLARYYEEEGANARIRISLAPGRYVPEFLLTGSDTEHELPVQQAGKTGSMPVMAEAPAGRRLPFVLAMLTLLLTAGLVASVIAARKSPQQAVNSSRDREMGEAGTLPTALAAEIRILAGQRSAPYTDRFGKQWQPDRYFHGGVPEPGPKDFYGRPPDAGLFETMRTGEFSYDIPVPPGTYELRLYWAEPIFRLANENDGGGENERRFHVSVNGKRLLSAFDVAADSGISPVDIRAFRNITPDGDGMIRLQFTAAYGTPFLNGLELLPTFGGRMPPIRIRAHDLFFTDHEGNVWSPDNYYIGGRLATHKEPVAGTPDPELYAGERYGNFNYAIPVPAGKYAVTLFFAETWFRPDTDGQDRGGKGDRIFDVYCNGTTLLKDLDIFAKVGPFRAMSHTYHDIRPNGQGKILLSFSPTKNYASVKAIQVVEEP